MKHSSAHKEARQGLGRAQSHDPASHTPTATVALAHMAAFPLPSKQTQRLESARVITDGTWSAPKGGHVPPHHAR